MTTSNTLNIAAIQTQLYWEDRESNLNHLQKMMKNLEDETLDLVILPEMFTSGFTMNAAKCAEKEEGVTLDWMRKQAVLLESAITGSIIIEEDNQYYNRLYFVWPDGKYASYDKRHTFSYAGEDQVFSRGHKRLIVDYKGWKICPLICYDLRFPVWSRNTEEFDLLIYVANWPESRTQAWDTLLSARAIENLCYTIGVNRIGQDGNGISYVGHSSAYDPQGQTTAHLQDGVEGILKGTLEKKHLEKIRNRYRFLDDRDEFVLKI